jgi:hypothetical protein
MDEVTAVALAIRTASEHMPAVPGHGLPPLYDHEAKYLANIAIAALDNFRATQK